MLQDHLAPPTWLQALFGVLRIVLALSGYPTQLRTKLGYDLRPVRRRKRTQTYIAKSCPDLHITLGGGWVSGLLIHGYLGASKGPAPLAFTPNPALYRDRRGPCQAQRSAQRRYFSLAEILSTHCARG